MADINPDIISDREVLPLRAAKPRALDWNYKTGLSPVQLQLLVMYETLSFAAKSELTHGLKEGDFIPAAKIKSLYRQEQQKRQEPQKKSEAYESFADTTRSDLG